MSFAENPFGLMLLTTNQPTNTRTSKEKNPKRKCEYGAFTQQVGSKLSGLVLSDDGLGYISMTLHPRQQRSRGQQSKRKSVINQPPTNVKEEKTKTAAMFVCGGMWEFNWKRE